MATPTSIAAYLGLFAVVAGVFVTVNLLVGRLLRPAAPTPEKGEIYECGEPVIGSSFVQFDIRFYVVALLFIIFDVEVAFFFPWAVVFGKATHLSASAEVAADASGTEAAAWNADIAGQLADLGVTNTGSLAELAAASQAMSWGLFADIAVFFTILMVGFAYVWRRGDLDWVRTTVNAAPGQPADPATEPRAA